jgi:hypothetical protein
MKRTPRPAIYIATFITALAVGLVFAQFDGAPSSPQNFLAQTESADWDIQRHIRDISDWDVMQSMNAQHGTDCSAPPANHVADSYDEMVFICANHLMTSLNAPSYGLIYLTPNKLLDWSNGPATVNFEMSTERMSTRDWPDWWLTPWVNNLAAPFNQGDVDLQGSPLNTIHIETNNSEGAPFLLSTRDGVGSFHGPPGWQGTPLQSGITPGTNQAATRQPFRITVWETTVCPVGCTYTPDATYPTGDYTDVKFERLQSATGQHRTFFWKSIQRTTWTKAVFQMGHHSYTPTKDGAGVPATWHWDNVELSPSVPFTIIKATQRFTTGGVVHFDAPAPAGSSVRFTAIGTVSVNGQVVQPQIPTIRPNAFNSYFVPVPAGSTSVTFGFANDSYYTGPFRAKDMAFFSLSSEVPTSTPTSVPPTPTSTPTFTPTSTATATATPIPPTATSTPTPTEVPPTNTPTATATPEPPTSTPTPLPPTPTETPVPPTATATPTEVPPTSTPTATPVPPTPTPTPIPCEEWQSTDGGQTLIKQAVCD